MESSISETVANIGPRKALNPSRRGFLFAGATFSATAMVLASRGWNFTYINSYLEALGRSLKYGIGETVFSRGKFYEDLMKGHVRMQIYDLSCELASTCHMLSMLGIYTTEDLLFESLPKNVDPQLGVHHSLKIYLNGDKSRLGKLPPDPYGVYPEPIATALNNNGILAGSGLVAKSCDYRDFEKSGFEGWSGKINDCLSNNSPVVCWGRSRNDGGVVKNADGSSYAPFEHTYTIVGRNFDGSLYLAIDPSNCRELILTSSGLYKMAVDVGMGLLTVEEGDL